MWRDKCIKADRQYYWCSIDRIYSNRSAACEQECPYLARELVKNEVQGTKHTSCINSKTGTKGHFPSVKEIKIIIDIHNKIRSEVPVSATDMSSVVWDLGLARLAQRWAENAVFKHDCKNCRMLSNNRTIPTGQNGFLSKGLEYNASSFWQVVINAWYNEVKFFKYGEPSMQRFNFFIKSNS